METKPVSTISLIITFFVVAALIIAGGALLLLSRPEPVQITIYPPQPTATPRPTMTPEPIIIYVTGAVNQPDALYTLAYGSRVEAAIAAAGGLRADADRSRVNLAAVLRDGDQVHVPAISELAVDLPTPPGGQIVAINSASATELEALPGVGPVLAESIIAHREANGPFADLEALDAVRGIGPGLLEDIETLIRFD